MHPGTVGSFQILRELGRGGMGVVYLARDTRLERQVAIKALPADLADDPAKLARFQREARILASLSHANIAGIYGLEYADGQQHLVLEFIEGESLAARLSRGPIPVHEALRLARQIAEGLEAAHEKGIVHRDLKPGNVMVTPDGVAKVLDFGLARAGEAESDAAAMPGSPTVTSPARPMSPTIPGVIMGTVGYMSPEQARGMTVDKRSDIFSFGCVLFEMLTGTRAFKGETAADSLGAVLHREPDWNGMPRDATPAVRQLAKRCLAKDKGQRLHDIADARLELESAIQEPGSAVDSQGGPGIYGRHRRREALAWSMALLLALAAAALWYTGRRHLPLGPAGFRQLNIRSEAIFRAAFAPDGKTIVYSAAGAGNTPELFIVRPENPEPQSLGLKQTHLLSVSKRGELAVLTGAHYIGHRLFIGTLARIPLGGGAPRPLLENIREADWSPDAEHLAIIREVDGKDRLEFPIGRVLRETSGYLSDLRFNPAGNRIAFFEHPIKFDDRGSVNVVDLNGRASTLADGYAGLEGMAWSADGRGVLYSGTGTGGYEILGVTEGEAPHSIYSSPGNCVLEGLSPEGHWLVTQDDYPVEILVRTPGSDRDREFTWLGRSTDGVLSRDGRTLAFCEQTVGVNYRACVRATDGSPVAVLGDGNVSDISRDGKWVLSVVQTVPPALVAYPTGPGEPVRLDRAGIESYAMARWSCDGSKVLVNAAEPGKGPRWYLQDFPGGAPRPVTPEGVRRGVLSPDEREILAPGPGGVFAIYTIGGGEPRPVQGLTESDVLLQWCVDGASVLVARQQSVPCAIEQVELASGRRQAVLQLAPPDLAGATLIVPTYFSDDLHSYVYNVDRTVSKLYVSERLR
jgi:eukaryotic-like serine/threonine-protein kinase